MERDGKTSRSLTSEEQFKLYAFGDYSRFHLTSTVDYLDACMEADVILGSKVFIILHNTLRALRWCLPVGHQNFVLFQLLVLMWSDVVALYSCLDRPKDEEPGCESCLKNSRR
jgi:hypothetical protein